jgi:hypothetical protein
MTQYKLFGGFIYPKDNDDEDSCDPCVAKPIESSRITYDGPNLSCSGIHTCDNLTVMLQKLDEQLCSLKLELFNLTSTTTLLP